MPLVEVEGLTVRFGDRAAVDNVGFAIMPGERFGVIGESGSGKSMTAMAITGLLPPNARRGGRIRFDGQPVPETDAGMAELRGDRIGMVFQEPMTALNPLMRAGAQIAEAVELHFPRRAADEHVAALLSEVGLEPRHAGRYPHQLSGGQRQRVMIAMALAAEPDLLICDEPTSALDLITQAQVLALLDRLCGERGMALMFISHDLRAVARLCTRVTVLRSGMQVESGPAAEIFSSPRDPYTQRLVAAAKAEIEPCEPPVRADVLASIEKLRRIFPAPGLGMFRRGEAHVAVDAVSFTIGTGEALALVGPSGCGKSTLARMIAGLERSSSGTVRFGGQRFGDGKPLPKGLRRDISLVFQDPFGSFDPRQRIGDALAEPLRLLPGLKPIDRHARVARAIEDVGLPADSADRYPHEFSGGQRQRLAIARALVTRPKLVILDEPVSALDVSVRAELLALINRLRAAHGLSYLLISHDLEMVRRSADRVLVMEAGRIVEEGTPDTLFAAPKHALTQALLAARLPEPA